MLLRKSSTATGRYHGSSRRSAICPHNRRPSGIGVVLDNTQIGLVGMMVQTVEHVRRFAHRRRNDPRVKRPIIAGHVGVEDRAGIDAIFGVDGTAALRAATGPEILAIRRRGCPVIPDRSHRVPVVRVDDRGAGRDVVVVADVPLCHVDEMKIAEASRRVGHTGET